MTTIDGGSHVQISGTAFKVRSSAYAAPSVFEAEMTKIFESSWVYVGHESEITRPGDYVTSWIGRQSVIVARTKELSIAVHVNACRHRGMALCRDVSGTTNTFRCPYHGWTYGLDGRLIGVSDRRGYPEDFVAEVGGLEAVPRVDSYRGLVFASLSRDVPSLDVHLAHVRNHIDYWADGSIGAEYRVRTPHRFLYPGNWKFQVENTVDGYHPQFVHESGFKVLSMGSAGAPVRDLKSEFAKERGCTRGIRGGHSTLERPALEDQRVIGLASLPDPQYREYMDALTTQHGLARAEEIRTNRHVYVFPNLFLMDVNIRVLNPLAVDQTEVRSYFTEASGVSTEVNRIRLDDLQRRLGTTGLVGLDDLEVFAANQTAVATGRPEWLYLSRGMLTDCVNELGECVGSYSSEAPQRSFWGHWDKVMSRVGTDA